MLLLLIHARVWVLTPPAVLSKHTWLQLKQQLWASCLRLWAWEIDAEASSTMLLWVAAGWQAGKRAEKNMQGDDVTICPRPPHICCTPGIVAPSLTMNLLLFYQNRFIILLSMQLDSRTQEGRVIMQDSWFAMAVSVVAFSISGPNFLGQTLAYSRGGENSLLFQCTFNMFVTIPLNWPEKCTWLHMVITRGLLKSDILFVTDIMQVHSIQM